MKQLILLLGVIALGLAIGGGSAYAAGKLLAGKPLITVQSEHVFVPTGSIVAPLVAEDGHLLGYMTFDAQLEVPANQVAHVRANLPLLLDAATLRTFKAPIAGGRDGLVPKLDIVRTIVADAARQTYGPALVSRVVIIQASML